MKKLALSTATTLICATLANASVIAYNNNPTANSVDFANGVGANSGVITTLDFENLQGYDPHMYAGVTFAFNTPADLRSGFAGAGSGTSPTSPGEGLQNGSTHIYPGAAAYQMSITFDDAVLAAGFFLIDYYNPSGANTGTLRAWDGAAGTGNLIGSAVTANFNFQQDNKYFVGILSTDANIKSITFGSSGIAGDGIYIDDVKYATLSDAPEPGTWMMISGGLLSAGLLNRRRKAL